MIIVVECDAARNNPSNNNRKKTAEERRGGGGGDIDIYARNGRCQVESVP